MPAWRYWSRRQEEESLLYLPFCYGVDFIWRALCLASLGLTILLILWSLDSRLGMMGAPVSSCNAFSHSG